MVVIIIRCCFPESLGHRARFRNDQIQDSFEDFLPSASNYPPNYGTGSTTPANYLDNSSSNYSPSYHLPDAGYPPNYDPSDSAPPPNYPDNASYPPNYSDDTDRQNYPPNYLDNASSYPPNYSDDNAQNYPPNW